MKTRLFLLWVWVCLLFLVLDFSTRQIYLICNSRKQVLSIQVYQEKSPASQAEAPPEDPQLLRSTKDGRHPFYHHGLRA